MLRFLRHLRAAFRRPALDADLREELAQHVEWKARAYMDDGVPPGEARRRAAVDVGNPTRLREDAHDMWGFPALESVTQDITYGIRLLRRSPAFTAVAIVSLAIGIGASAAVFSLADAVFLQTMPVRDPASLFVVKWRSGPVFPFSSLNGYGEQNDAGLASTSFSYAAYDAFRKEAAAYVDVLGFADLYQVTVVVDGRAELGTAHAVSANYFDLLGVQTAAGRALTAADDDASAPAAAVISDEMARKRFGAPEAALGRTAVVNSVPFTIVGVAPPAFHGTGQVGTNPDLYVPLALKRRVVPNDDPPMDPNFWWVLMMARTKPGVSQQAAQSALDVLLQRTVHTAKPNLDAKALPHVTLLPGGHGQVEDRAGMLDPLRTMAYVAAIVLLIACANVAGLLLARGRARLRELSVRVAIGAPRRRVVRQLATEALLLAVAGGVLGVLVARWASGALAPALTANAGSTQVLTPLSLRVVAFAALTAVASALLFGLAPAFRATRVNVSSALQDAGRDTVRGQRRLLSGGLVVMQIALALLLVTGAGLLVRSVGNLEDADLGFDASHLLLFRIDPASNGYEGARLRDLYAQVLERARAVPGVVSASLSSHKLISNSASIGVAARQDEEGPEPGSAEMRAFQKTHLAWNMAVDERFFETLGIPLVRGRAFLPSDEGGQPVAVVNRALARQLFGTEDAIGRELRFGSARRVKDAPGTRIIGIARDARYSSLRDDKPPTLYVYYRQVPDMKSAPTFEIRSAGAPSALAGAMREIIREIDPRLPLFGIGTQSEQIASSIRRERLFARLAALLGTVAMLLSAIGIYGLLAYGVARRTPEIGLRMALGAMGTRVQWMILRESLWLAVIGLAVGVPLALAGTRVLAALLFGLEARDPMTIAGASTVIVLLAVGAGYLPARRAARVDPLIALRAE